MPPFAQAEDADVHVAGTPCVDFSVRGSTLGEQGDAFLCFLCWAAGRRYHQESIVIQENVKGFPQRLLIDLLGDIYDIQAVVINPSNHGFPSERPRQWVVMRHRSKTHAFTCNLSTWVSMFQAPSLFGLYETLQPMMPGWSVYFQNDESSAAYLFAELLWASSRADSGCREDGCRFKSVEDFTHALLNEYESVKDEFYKALNQFEKRVLVDYKALSPDMCYSLNQNPDFGATTSTWESLHTVIKNAGIIWNLALLYG